MDGRGNGEDDRRWMEEEGHEDMTGGDGSWEKGGSGCISGEVSGDGRDKEGPLRCSVEVLEALGSH